MEKNDLKEELEIAFTKLMLDEEEKEIIKKPIERFLKELSEEKQ